MTTITNGTFFADAALPTSENPLPFFRDVNHDLAVRMKDGVPIAYQRLMGFGCGKRVLPYRVQDRYDRNRKPTEIPSIILENEYMRATFLPTLGGRLISLINKINDCELLYCNTSLQVGNLANRDAWFAGGIEWNVGQYGHAFSTCSPVYVSIQEDEKGIPFLRIYDYERCKNLWWHIDFHLSNEEPVLYAHVQIHNLSETDTSLYYWTNTAVHVDDYVRVLSSSNHAVYLDPYVPKGERLFGYMRMPEMPIYPGLDVSYPQRFPASNEYFFTCDEDSMPWECALNKDGSGYFEVSTPPLLYRKMFCWGSHAGGQRWQRELSPDTAGQYIELQSGLACTQLHGQILNAKKSICWTQAFGMVDVDPKRIHEVSYDVAMQNAGIAIETIIDRKKLDEQYKKFLAASRIAPHTILYRGSGWGFLEMKLAEVELPPAFLFDVKSVGDEEAPYYHLAVNRTLAVMNPEEPILAPPPCTSIWKELFLKVIGSNHLSSLEKATLQHYLGIIYLENEEVSLAQTCWLEVMSVLPNAWTARNLAQLEQRRGEVKESMRWYAKAFKLPGFLVDPAIAEEYATLLVEHKMQTEARQLFDVLESQWLQSSEKLVLLRARLAAMEHDATLIKALVFTREFGHIREGDTILNDLWLAAHVIEYTTEHNIEANEEVVAKVKELYPIPAKYNLTMFR